MGIFAKCICPSCFNEINLGDCRILSGRTSGKVLKHPSKSLFQRMNVEPLTGPFYTTELARRECHVCNYLLPKNIERVPSITLVVVGDVSSGKSSFLASFIHQLRTGWINNSRSFVRFQCLTPDIQQEYITNYFEPLFTHRKSLAPSELRTSPYAQPLIYELALAPSPRHPVTVANLMIYDTSGEDYEAEDRIVNFARFVLNTDAFIFVVNPVVIPNVFNNLDPALKAMPRLQAQFAAGQKSRPAERLNATLDIYEQYHGHAKGARLADIPVSVMISKSDLLQGGVAIRNQPYYGDGIDLQDIQAVDWEVRDLLERQYGQGELVGATSRLARAKFFATSATGEAPDISDNFTNVQPLRCLDPVLWILHELAIIRPI